MMASLGQINLANRLFISGMGLFWLLMWIHIVDTASHSCISTVTQVEGVSGITFTAVTKVDGLEVCYYDCVKQKLFSKQDWMNESLGDFWNKVSARHTDMCRHFTMYTDNVKNNSSHRGVLVYQRKYSCTFDGESRYSDTFDIFEENENDVFTLQENRPLSKQAVYKWEKQTGADHLSSEKHNCFHWLNEFLNLGKIHFKGTVDPELFLVRKDHSSSVMCQATSFFPENITISWMKDTFGYIKTNVKMGELIPNEDGTFQISSELTVTPDEWKWSNFRCEVVTPYNFWKVMDKKNLTFISNSETHNTGLLIGLIVSGIVSFALVVTLLVCVFRRHDCISRTSKTKDIGTSENLIPGNKENRIV